MTLTELKYLVTLARERHFGRAAAACFVSQPTLSVAVRKFEDELGVKVFERGAQDIALTVLGEQIVAQAQGVLQGAALLVETAQRGKNPLSGTLRLGVIHTIAPYVLPSLVKHCVAHFPNMPLVLHENYNGRLLEQLKDGSLDCALLAEPFNHSGLATAQLYDEPLVAVLPRSHSLGPQAAIDAQVLVQEPILLMGQDHCFRSLVLDVTGLSTHPRTDKTAPKAPPPESLHTVQNLNGTSLETLKHMVAAGMGVSVLPFLSVPKDLQSAMHALIEQQLTKVNALTVASASAPMLAAVSAVKSATAQRPRRTSVAKRPKVADDMLSYHVLLSSSAGDVNNRVVTTPTRRVVLAWRRSFTRPEAVAALRHAVLATQLTGLRYV